MTLSTGDTTFVLGSRSPRRRQLLESIVGTNHLRIHPPTDSDEAGFDGLRDVTTITKRLTSVTAAKMEDVRSHLPPDIDSPVVITADTVVVATQSDGTPIVLGKPDPQHWVNDVTSWMLELYSGKSHDVWTAFRIVHVNRTEQRIVKTRVRFVKLTPGMVSWYTGTGESPGKAGGYAIQGTAAAFVDAIDGSLSNVIGLPIIEVIQVLESMGLMAIKPPAE